MRINLQAHYETRSGYGRMGHHIAGALCDLGVENAGDLGTAFSPEVPLERVALWLSTPPHVRGWYEGQFAAILTMWESTEIPPGFRENLHHFDRVFVPSLQNLELYRRFHDDVRYIPLGVDGEAWKFQQRPTIKRDFVFLTAGYGTRKGCRQVADAFYAVFPEGKPPSPLMPIPKLIVRSRDDITGPGVTRISQDLSNREEIELYASAHCFVSGSKGEGWGLMPLQAMAQGLPTILGKDHGHAAYAHHGIPLKTHPVSAKGATFWGDGGEWWEPDFKQMCDAMWAVYTNYAEYEDRASKASDLVRGEFTWQHTAESLIFNLPEIFEPAPTERVWRGAPPRLFHLRVNQVCTFTVNGVDNFFEPGKDYYEAADVKRAVIAAGKLDWATFDPNDLGVEDNVDVAVFRAANSICPTCKMPFNRDDTLADLVKGL